LYTPERHLPTPGQHGHSPQRHTAVGTAAPTTADTGNTVPTCPPPSQHLGLLVTFVLWDAASLYNTSGEYALFGSLPKLSSYIETVLTPMVAALAHEPVTYNERSAFKPVAVLGSQ